MLDAIVDPCVVLAPVHDDRGDVVDFLYVDANAAACTFNRATRTELIGRSLRGLVPMPRTANLVERYAETLRTGRPTELDGYVVQLRSDAEGVRERVLDIRAVLADETVIVTWHDVTDRTALVGSLAESERRYRLLAERVTDIVFEIDEHGIFQWISPAVATVAGWNPESLLGTDATDLLAPEDFAFLLQRREGLRDGEAIDAREVRVRTAQGDFRWMLLRASGSIGPDGALARVIVGLRDCHTEVMARRAADTLAAANAVLVRAVDEDGLLAEMCRTAVHHGGYRYAWYCRKVHDADHTVQLVAEAGTRGSLVPEDGVRWTDADVRGTGPTGTALRTGRTTNLDDLSPALGDSVWHRLRTDAGFLSALSLPVFVDGEMDGVLTVYAPDAHAFDDASSAVLQNLADQLGTGLGRLRAGEALAAAVAAQELFTAAIEQSAESIIITDPAANIIYANPAAARSTGYTVDELYGQNPRLFQSGHHDGEFYASMWARLVGGQSFHGTLVNRRKNGELYEEDATVTPVHDAAGRLRAYVGVKRELGREQRLAAVIDSQHDDRDVLLDIMRRVRPADTFEGTAAILCEAVTRLAGFDGAVLLQFKDGAVVPVGLTREEPDVLVTLDEEILVDDVELFVRNTAQGAWWLDLEDEDGPAGLFPTVAKPLRSLGFRATAYAPLRWDGEMIAAISVVISTPVTADWISSRLQVLEEFAGFAGLLLGEQAKRHEAIQQERATVRRIIDEHRFHPVFQPIVDLSTGKVRGYEALSRFDDGVRPDARIAAAHEVGMGSELERALAMAALVAAEPLPADAWLSINFSPSTVLDGTAAGVVRATDRQLVLEITEQIGVESYPAVRRAFRECRPAQVAVDDAGAGFASLRHIVELEPDLVKVDIGLVRDIDVDPARQALASGLRHFCSLAGITLIAEGVERLAEADTLIHLGVELGQGYHFGRPAPLT